jgi:hypothetical protein
MDSAATSTVIRAEDKQYINITNEPSTKVFYNANGTLSRAGNKATRYNLRSPANEADMVPSLSMNSLMSTSKLADANYVTVFFLREPVILQIQREFMPQREIHLDIHRVQLEIRTQFTPLLWP